MKHFHFNVIAALFFHLALFAAPTFGGEFDHWRQTADTATRIDHAAWQALLTRYVKAHDDGVNRFEYGAVDANNRAQLDAYLGALEKVTVTKLRDDEQLAYWINLYNALTVRVILDHYPIDSIRDIRYNWLVFGPWKEKLTEVEGRKLSLDDIEHEIVRPIFGDSRIHYAFNCASIGCPNLQPIAFTRDNLESLLDRAAREYINHPRGVRFDGRRVIGSSLYDWYQSDFGRDKREVIGHLRQYANAGLRARLADVEAIDDFFYDWSLNDG